MFEDCFGHFGRFAVMARVVATHLALQFRELAHHVGEQVALGELCRALHQRRVGTEQCGNLRAQGANAGGLVRIATELCLVRYLGKPRFAGGKRLLAVGVVEERGVRQAWTYHALIAGTHLCGITADDIADSDEPRRQFAVGSAHWEIALVLHERRDEHLFWQGEEALFELADYWHRPFHQRSHFVQQFDVE